MEFILIHRNSVIGRPSVQWGIIYRDYECQRINGLFSSLWRKQTYTSTATSVIVQTYVDIIYRDCEYQRISRLFSSVWRKQTYTSTATSVIVQTYGLVTSVHLPRLSPQPTPPHLTSPLAPSHSAQLSRRQQVQ